MTVNQQNSSTNLYIVSALALIFFVGTILFSWATLPAAKRGVAETAGEGPAGAPQVSQAGAAEVAAGNPDKGQEIYGTICIACHGQGGVGIQGLGKDMTTSEFIAGLSDQELVEFITVGRDPSDPLNTTGIAMPAKGGNPSLDDEDLLDIVAYIRSIQK